MLQTKTPEEHALFVEQFSRLCFFFARKWMKRKWLRRKFSVLPAVRPLFL